MKTSPAGAAFIAALEGVVTRAYRDAAGVMTIGVGHTAAAGEPKPARGMTITRDEAMRILSRDFARFEPRVAARLDPIPQTAFDGAVSFDFNTGAIDRASWVQAFRAGDPVDARQKLALWTKAGGRTIAGLVRRREAEARLIFDGEYAAIAPSSDEVKAWQANLAALGFYGDAIDGVAGPESIAAVQAYQRRHPDLVADGVVGPATRASIARDLAVRRGTAAGAAAAAAGAGAAAASGGGHSALSAILAAFVVVAIIGAVLTFRYRDELKRMLAHKKET